MNHGRRALPFSDWLKLRCVTRPSEVTLNTIISSGILCCSDCLFYEFEAVLFIWDVNMVTGKQWETSGVNLALMSKTLLLSTELENIRIDTSGNMLII